MLTVGPERDHREGEERRDRGDDRRQEVDRLVGQRRHDVFLERQLQAVGEALQVAAPADPVGADPLLHPGDDLALEHDREQRHEDQHDEDADDLDEHDPPDVVPEVLERRLVRRGQQVHAAPPALRRTTPPGPEPRSVRISLPGDLIGSQTTRSGIAVIRTGRVTDPVAPLDGEPVAVGDAEPRGGVRADPGHRRPGGAGQLGLVALQRADVDQLPPGGEDGALAGGQRRGRPAGGRRGRRPHRDGGRRRARRARRGPPPAWAAAGRRPSRRPGPAAPGRRAAARCRAGSRRTSRARPSQSR